jgi:hypothetical protein
MTDSRETRLCIDTKDSEASVISSWRRSGTEIDQESMSNLIRLDVEFDGLLRRCSRRSSHTGSNSKSSCAPHEAVTSSFLEACSLRVWSVIVKDWPRLSHPHLCHCKLLAHNHKKPIHALFRYWHAARILNVLRLLWLGLEGEDKHRQTQRPEVMHWRTTHGPLVMLVNRWRSTVFKVLQVIERRYVPFPLGHNFIMWSS